MSKTVLGVESANKPVVDEKGQRRFILAIVVGAMFCTNLLILFFADISEENKDMLWVLSGILGAKFSDVISYYFGSSQGSADKNNLLTSKK